MIVRCLSKLTRRELRLESECMKIYKYNFWDLCKTNNLNIIQTLIVLKARDTMLETCSFLIMARKANSIYCNKREDKIGWFLCRGKYNKFIFSLDLCRESYY